MLQFPIISGPTHGIHIRQREPAVHFQRQIKTQREAKDRQRERAITE